MFVCEVPNTEVKSSANHGRAQHRATRAAFIKFNLVGG
jgi:hypothetical protein